MHVFKCYKGLLSDRFKFRVHKWIKNTSSYTAIGTKGALVTEVFEPVQAIPGWFTLDDAAHFHLILETQSQNGLKGDMLEIGSYHGRSAAVMARSLRAGEALHICDAFESTTDDHYADKPTPEKVRANVLQLSPTLEHSQIVIHECLSDDLEFHEPQKFRFIHIDGGHTAEQVYADLETAERSLDPRGVVVVDDYGHLHWPGVAEGTDAFMNDNADFRILADMNRHGALGRKLYISRDD